MAIYTVHVPDDAPDPITRGERTIFLREGFSPLAFIFGAFYLFWHRLWAAAAVWVVLLLAFVGLTKVLDLPPACFFALTGLMHLYVGTQGPDLVRWGLGRRGYTMRDLVSAPGLSAAEALFFTRHPEAIRTAPVPTPTARWIAPATGPAVIGIFPDGDRA